MLVEEISKQDDVWGGVEAATVTDRDQHHRREAACPQRGQRQVPPQSAQLIQLWCKVARLSLRLAAEPGSAGSSARF